MEADCITSIEELVSELRSCQTKSQFVELVKCLDIDEEALTPYATWNDERYTRNCIYANDQFELIALCWLPGQITPIHCHNKQDCWMYSVSGLIEEEQFEKNEAGEPQYMRAQDLKAGNYAFINDDMGIHRLSNIGGTRSITLHLYVSPIQECTTYKEGQEGFEWKQLKYDTNYSDRFNMVSAK